VSASVRTGRTAARTVLGAVERVAIPAWGIERLEARVDTGARTSALHVENLSELGDGRVRFELKLARRKPGPIEASVTRRGRVRSTSGKIEPRVFVTTVVRLGASEHRIEIGLVDRRHMLYRMLLGRSALAGSFLVDPAERFLADRRSGAAKPR
jgi:hypothetical protein